ncbi:outer membrane protein assembly factor BamA [Cryomorpha ignava]|uniref:Outer membrane protein assembly factor BamA n=1 Tax=Cryomorpha ignava TaxID=101383 RepID=A0A7K3WJZ7_9FLAO|nr:outer membrane protein assembly factor BamA [Cryomorpha ignava]NEN21967.1 outer membrane protein assembly factor BamA [Cryomorpha ignava]
MNKTRINLILACMVGIMGFYHPATAQVGVGDFNIDYRSPREFTIGGLTVSGARNFDTQAIILFSGLSVGQKITIPGDQISQAIKNLWKQKLFDNITISISEIKGNEIFLDIGLVERPRLSRYKFEGISKGEAENLREKINLIRGSIVNENLLTNTSNIIEKYFEEKGYLDTEVNISQHPDTLVPNSEYLILDVQKNDKVKIGNITFTGVNDVSEAKLRRALKNTKEKNFFRIWKRSKFIRASYREDLKKITAIYNEMGYRNAKIQNDSVYRNPDGTVGIDIDIYEGNQFYFGNIEWVGNTKYTSSKLSEILGIEKGEIYDQSKFESRLIMSANGGDVSSLYLDDGYLAFQAIPVEKSVQNDTIDVQIKIYEGRQYRINRVIIKGNTKTNDRVVRREIRTKPGDLFSRSDIIRTQRELSQLGYFDPESFGINPVQNDQDGTVDIIYTLAERPSDQIELSGGWGAGSIVGTLGLSFTNFSMRNFFKAGAWDPLPSGDGQRLSIRAQTNGRFFQSYNASFTEPWLGGKKPNSFTVGVQRSIQTNGVTKKQESNGFERQALIITGGSVSLGKRLGWPDDYFQILGGVSYLYYDIQNYRSGNNTGIFALSNGTSNNLSFIFNLSRNSVFDPIYPRYGSNIRLNTKVTLPYSLWDGIDYAGDITDETRYQNAEYYKWKLVAEWYTELAPKLVLMTRSGFGFLGYYNRDKGVSAFERFYLGGSALSGFALDGREIIGLRGYDDLSLSPATGSNIVIKQTMELRYLISPNPSATIFALGFLEAGNTYDGIENFDPFRMYRSAGVGLRIFLPMFGLMGLDYGWRFDDVLLKPSMPRSQFHFTIGMNLGEL